MAIRRPGKCPVFTERHQTFYTQRAADTNRSAELRAKDEADAKKSAPHIMLPVRRRCKECPETNKYNQTDRCDNREHPNWSRCSGCGYEERDFHYCDTFVSRPQGRMTVYGFCDRKAVEQRDARTDYFNKTIPSPGSWLCKQHLPENVDARVTKARTVGAAKYAAETESLRYGWIGKGYEKILLEMAGWMAKNHDLVETDEWLGQISEMMTKNEQLMKVLGVPSEEED